MSKSDFTREPEAREVSRTVGNAISGASAGAVLGSVGGLPGTLAGAFIGAIANVAVGHRSPQTSTAKCGTQRKSGG